MTAVGIKCVYVGEYVNPDTKVKFHMFSTCDFCESVAIKADYVRIPLVVDQIYRVNFESVAFVNDKGRTDSFLACKVAGKVC